jgi:hypothetical protein
LQDLAPDLASFPKLKIKVKGSFDIQSESQMILDSMKENDFHGASEAWKKQMDCGICSQGGYFEGDGSQIKLSPRFLFDLVRELSNEPCIFKGIVSRPGSTPLSNSKDDSD